MTKELITFEEIEKRIYLIRGQRVMLDSNLSELYEIKTKVLNQAVKRNIARFPSSFMFQLTDEETKSLRSQFVTSNKRGGRRYLPYVFTEHGVLMLASVLNSEKAIALSVQIIEAFVRLRKEFLTLNKTNFRLDAIEGRLTEHDEAFELFNKVLLPLLETLEKPKRKIGFQPDEKKDEDST